MEEAPVVVTAATGALGPVVAKLSALLRRGGEYKLRRRNRKDVKLIRSKLKSVHSILWVIREREDLDAAGKKLRMEAWRLADDMNDAIDNFILSLKCSNDKRRFIQAKNRPNRPFEDLKRRAVQVSEQCRNRWNMETPHTIFSSLFSRTKSTVDSGSAKRPVDPYVHKDISELVGMEGPRDKLINHLVREGESTLQLKMAAILGPAGVGKTTLARLVFEAIQDKFQARAFVSVSSSRNTTEVLASILQQIAGLPDNTAVPVAGTKEATEKHLIDTISNFLKDKRYLVTVDDIWHYVEWKTIKMSLPDNNLGSRIVTTSHVIALTEKWSNDFDALVHKIFYLDDYSVKGMIALKSDMVGEGFVRGHGIVDMCRDMPLAMVCMISAMANERERQQQQAGLCVVRTRDAQDRIEEQVKRNGIQNTPGFEPLVQSLELGYKDLPHHMLKTCLLYCSIYPQGHNFNKDDLVIRWIAEGFCVCKEAAKDYFDELVSRGLFHEFRSDGVNSFYKLHPMIRNYLRWKLREDNFITCTSDGVPSSPVGRLCIDDNLPSSDLGVDWHHIRSLVVFKDAERVPYKHLQNLRALDVQYNHVLEQQHLKDMCGLHRLRHLFVSGGLFGRLGINEIPAEIARLQYLETLEVRKTGITKLPAEMGDLKQLKTLDVGWSKELAELPREMGNLQHLETLIIRESKIREQAWEVIGTLKKLKTLDVSSNREVSVIPREIGELVHLETQNLRGTKITELPHEIGNLQWLQTLRLSETEITELPREIGNLQRLQILDLAHVSTITKLPRDIGKLHHLEKLDLRDTNVKKIPREIGGLKKLKNLSVEIGILPFEAGQLPKLEGLPKGVRSAWKNSDLVSSLVGEILSFETTAAGSIGDGGLVVGTKHMHIPQWIKQHFNNITSLDIRVCKLEEQDLKILREMPYLLRLTLRFEAVPRKPIAISGAGFAKLVALTVDSRVPRFTFQEGAMPRLELLTFESQFYGGPPDTYYYHQPMGIQHLVSLREVIFRCNKWYRTDSPCIDAAISVVRREAQEHPKWFQLTLVNDRDRVVQHESTFLPYRAIQNGFNVP